MPDSVQALERKIAALRAAVQQLSALAEISVQLNATLDINQLLQYIIHEAQRLLDCEGASILLYDPQKKDLFFAAVSGSSSAQLHNLRVPINSSLAGKIFRQNRVIMVHNPQASPDHYDQIARKHNFTISSLLGVPLSIRGQPIGVLEAINKRHGKFGEEDGGLLSIMASQAAVAIQNARMVQALQKAYDEIQEVEHLKSVMLALAAHELRTPLVSIIGYAAFIEEESHGEIAEFARNIQHSAERMNKIVEDISALANLNQRGQSSEVQAHALAPIVNQVVASLKPAVEEKAHQIRLALSPQASPVLCNASQLNLALKNILHNAIRFTPKGGRIEIGARREKNGEYALIWVRDNGIGLKKEHLEKIFTEFYQVEDHLTRQHGGLGVGLSIARALIRAQGGTVWAQSEGLNKGATFYIRLHLAHPN